MFVSQLNTKPTLWFTTKMKK